MTTSEEILDVARVLCAAASFAGVVDGYAPLRDRLVARAAEVLSEVI